MHSPRKLNAPFYPLAIHVGTKVDVGDLRDPKPLKRIRQSLEPNFNFLSHRMPRLADKSLDRGQRSCPHHTSSYELPPIHRHSFESSA